MDSKQIVKNSNQFSFVDTVANLAVNRDYVKGYIDLLNGRHDDKTFIWETLSATGNEIGNVLYENVLNYIQNVADINTCSIKSLCSLSKMLGVKNYKIVDNFDKFPNEILRLMDIFSIGKAYLFDGNVLDLFSKVGIELSSQAISGYAERMTELSSSMNSFLSSDISSEISVNNYIDNEFYSNFVSGVFHDALMDGLNLTYDGKNDKIYENVSASVASLSNYSSDFLNEPCLNEIQSLQRVLNIPVNFKPFEVADEIDNGERELSDLEADEQKLVSKVLEFRKYPKYNRNAQSYELTRTETKYSYYREKEFYKFVSFIEEQFICNKNPSNFYSIVWNSKPYYLNDNFTELSVFPETNIEGYEADRRLFQLSGGMDENKVDAVAKLLRDICFAIVDVREKLKTQAQRNHMRGTFLLISYVINQYLRKNLPLQYPSLSTTMLSLYNVQDSLDKTNQINVQIQEYEDNTEYYNITTEFTDEAMNKYGTNSRYWEDDLDELGMDLQEIDEFYLSTLNLRDSISADETGYKNPRDLLDILFDCGATKTFVDARDDTTIIPSVVAEGYGVEVDKNPELSTWFYEISAYQTETFLKFNGNLIGYTPYFNYKNTTHSSYQIHPYLWKFTEYEGLKSTIQNAYFNSANEDIMRVLASKNLSVHLGEYGNIKNIWKDNAFDFSGYRSRYENGSHSLKNGILEHYDGLWYPKAIDEYALATMDDIKFLTLLHSVYNRKTGKEISKDLFDNIGASVDVFGNECYLSSLYPEIVEQNKKILSAKLDWENALSTSNDEEYVLSLHEIYKTLEDSVDETYYGKWYNAGISEDEAHYIASQLSVYELNLLEMYSGQSSNDKIKDIYKYGIDKYGNSILLYKEYAGNASYNEKRNTPGELWIRKNAHPIGFPAFASYNEDNEFPQVRENNLNFSLSSYLYNVVSKNIFDKGIRSVTVSEDGKIIYVIGLASYEIFKSINYGNTWSRLNRIPNSTNPLLDIKTWDGQTVWAIDTYRLFKSTDGGNTWEKISSVPTYGPRQTRFAVSQTGQHVYILSHNPSGTGNLQNWGISKSSDYGVTFNTIEIEPKLGNAARLQIATNASGNLVVTSLKVLDNGSSYSLLRSNDYCESFVNSSFEIPNARYCVNGSIFLRNNILYFVDRLESINTSLNKVDLSESGFNIDTYATIPLEDSLYGTYYEATMAMDNENDIFFSFVYANDSINHHYYPYLVKIRNNEIIKKFITKKYDVFYDFDITTSYRYMTLAAKIAPQDETNDYTKSKIFLLEPKEDVSEYNPKTFEYNYSYTFSSYDGVHDYLSSFGDFDGFHQADADILAIYKNYDSQSKTLVLNEFYYPEDECYALNQVSVDFSSLKTQFPEDPKFKIGCDGKNIAIGFLTELESDVSAFTYPGKNTNITDEDTDVEEIKNNLYGRCYYSENALTSNVEYNSFDRFDQYLNIATIPLNPDTQRVYPEIKSYNLNSDASYIPLYAGTFGEIRTWAVELYKNVKEKKSIELLGFSFNYLSALIEDFMNGIYEDEDGNWTNNDPTKYLSCIARVWEEYNIDHLFGMYFNPALKTPLEETESDPGFFLWEQTLSQAISSENIGDYKALMFNIQRGAANPIYTGDLSDIATGNTYISALTKADEYFLSNNYTYPYIEEVVGTPNVFAYDYDVTKASLDTNSILNIKKIEMDLKQDQNGDYHLSVMLFRNELSNYIVDKNSLVLLIYNTTLAEYNDYHYLYHHDTWPYLSFQQPPPISTQINTPYLSTAYEFTEISALSTGTIAFKINEESNSIGIKYPPRAVDDALFDLFGTTDKSFSSLCNVFELSNTYIFEIEKPKTIADVLGTVGIGVYEGSDDAILVYEDYVSAMHSVSKYDSDLIEYCIYTDLSTALLESSAQQLSASIPEDVADDILNCFDYLSGLSALDIVDGQYKISNIIGTPVCEEGGYDDIGMTDIVEYKVTEEDVKDFLKIYVNYLEDEETGKLKLYFNYNNLFCSPYSYRRSDNRFYTQFKPETWLSLEPGESGFLTIVVQIKYFNSLGVICGVKDIPILNYKIWNISDDKPKFIIKNTWTITKEFLAPIKDHPASENSGILTIGSSTYTYPTEDALLDNYTTWNDLTAMANVEIAANTDLGSLTCDFIYDFSDSDVEFIPSTSLGGRFSEYNGLIHTITKNTNLYLNFRLNKGAAIDEETCIKEIPIEAMNVKAVDKNGEDLPITVVNGSIIFDFSSGGTRGDKFLAKEYDKSRPIDNFKGYIVTDERKLVRIYQETPM